jgi:hypothetical protein
MPVENIITDNGLGVVTRCWGVLGAAEFIEAIRDRYTPDDALQRVRYFITDHTDVERFDIWADDIYALTKITTAASGKNPHIHLASVVPSEVGFGLVRMWHGYAHEVPWQFRLCRSRQEAEEWLRECIDVTLRFTEAGTFPDE